MSNKSHLAVLISVAEALRSGAGWISLSTLTTDPLDIHLLTDENAITYCTHFTCSHFPCHLQKLLGRASPVHIHLQATVQKVTKHSRESLRVLQLWCPICSYQIQCLGKTEMQDSTCFQEDPGTFFQKEHKTEVCMFTICIS